MARPAGYSSDEDYSDDDFYFSEEVRRRPLITQKSNNFFIPLGQRLLVALSQQNIEEAIKLIKDGTDVNFKSEHNGGWTPLMMACSMGAREVISLLLENGANVNDHHELVSPLMCICDCTSVNEKNILDCINILVNYGADINAVDWCNICVLTYAVKQNRLQIVHQLIQYGCELNKADAEGWTPIFFAVDYGYFDIVKVLIDSGSDIHKTDIRGQSLIDIALNKYHTNIVELLKTNDESTEIEEFIEIPINLLQISDYCKVLLEIPNSKYGRLHGFHSDVIKWIQDIHMGHLAKYFVQNEISLGQLFTMNDEHLKKIGLTFSFDRKKILFFVQKLLEHNWGRNCLKVSKNKDIDLIITAQHISTMVRQAFIINIAVNIWKLNHIIPINNNCMTNIQEGLFNLKLLKKELTKIHTLAKKIEAEQDVKVADFVYPKSKGYPYRKLLQISIPVGIIFLFYPKLIKAFNSR